MKVDDDVRPGVERGQHEGVVRVEEVDVEAFRPGVGRIADDVLPCDRKPDPAVTAIGQYSWIIYLLSHSQVGTLVREVGDLRNWRTNGRAYGTMSDGKKRR